MREFDKKKLDSALPKAASNISPIYKCPKDVRHFLWA